MEVAPDAPPDPDVTDPQKWTIAPLKPKPEKATPRKKFTEEEDERLRELVQKKGARKWNVIASYMPGRTGRQCRDRYRNYLVPGFFHGEWTQGEDDLLREKYNEYGPQWARITDFFQRRSANSLKNRWNYFVSRVRDGPEPEPDDKP